MGANFADRSQGEGRADEHPKLPGAIGIGAASRAEQNLEQSISAGLASEDILVYVERGDGRGNQRCKTVSTVAPKPIARWKATANMGRNEKVR